MELEVRRQLIHMSGAVTPFYLYFFYQRFSSWLAPEALVAGMLATGYGIAHLYKRGIRLPVFAKLVDIAEREEVRQSSPGKGTFRFFLGVLVCMLIFGSLLGAPFFVVGSGILVLALGDSMSTLAGRKLGRRKLPYNSAKSVEGTLLGTCYAFLGIMAYLHFFHGLEIQQAAVFAFAAASAGMLAESLPLKVDDNFVIPIAGSAAVYALNCV
ncbi:diacylglycerol/polyprenol kinase family protein [Candidatus Pyrohabitans sp.]